MKIKAIITNNDIHCIVGDAQVHEKKKWCSQHKEQDIITATFIKKINLQRATSTEDGAVVFHLSEQ